MSQGIDVSNFKFVEDMVFIIWKWEWRDGGEFVFHDDDVDDSTITVVPETQLTIESGTEDVEDAEEESKQPLNFALPTSSTITHTVTFKCIGCTKENRYQEALA